MAHNSTWSEEDLKTTRLMLGAHRSHREIAEKLNRKTGAVSVKIHRLGWSTTAEDARALNGLDKINNTNKCLLYVIECTDIDGTVFNKVGITTLSVESRFKNKYYKTIMIYKATVSECRKLESKIKKSFNHYRPKDCNFYKKGHSGYTECFITNNYLELSVIFDEINIW